LIPRAAIKLTPSFAFVVVNALGIMGVPLLEEKWNAQTYAMIADAAYPAPCVPFFD
jgi:hypothetical protein